MRFTVTTAAPPTAAFEAVADFGRLAEWDPFVRSVDIDGPPLEIGTVYTLTSPGGLTLRYRIIQIEPGTRVVYGGGATRGGSTDTITVTPDGRGSTVEIVSVLHFSGWVRLIGPVIRLLVWAGGRWISLPAMRRRLAKLDP